MARTNGERQRQHRGGDGRPVRRRVPYWVGYGLTAGTLLVVTAALVLIVLPSRYALVADLRESGFSFPTTLDGIGFTMAEPEPLIQPPAPAPRLTEPEPAPGPAEALWASVDSLLAAADHRAAIARMDAYLEEHPDDVDVRRERARTLALAGQTAAARAAFEQLARRTGGFEDRRALARTLRDAGEAAEAAALYRELVAQRPDDLALRHELARLYMWAERYPEAAVELRHLVAEAPDVGAYRLDLARTLYWDDRPADARTVLADMPADAAEAAEAASLDAELARLLTPPPEPEPEPPTRLERARALTADGQLTAAAALYDSAAAAAPNDSALARERIDFIQYRREDQEGAIRALEAYRERFGLDADGRYRLAQLYVWTGRRDEARAELVALVREHPGRADALGLLGDVYRYDDDRSAARDAYERARAIDPDEPHAATGLPELDRLRGERIAARDPAGYGPLASLFTDSDDFVRLDLGGSAGWTFSDVTLDLTAGWRRLEGRDPAGFLADDEGAFARFEGARWWSEASLRTAVRVGLDHLDAAGAEPVFGLSVERFGRSGAILSLDLEHGPAYPHTYTLESAAAGVAADRLEVAAATPLGTDWYLSSVAGLLRLTADGAEGTNTRWSGGVRIARRLSPWLAADVGTRLLGFTDPAPAPGRRLYWDPKLFWANTAGLTLGTTPDRGLGYRLRVSGGAAWTDERDAGAGTWIPQFGLEAGLAWTSERTRLDVGTFYRRSREDEYSSYGADLTLRIRP